MKNLFMANQLYTTNEQLNYIMNCDSKDHKALYETITARLHSGTEQHITPFSDWVSQIDPSVAVIGNVSPGELIRKSIRENEYGD